jgi:hypothetical protein
VLWLINVIINYFEQRNAFQISFQSSHSGKDEMKKKIQAPFFKEF